MLNTVLIKMTMYSSRIPTWFLLAGRGGTLLLRGPGVSCPKCTEGLGVWGSGHKTSLRVADDVKKYPQVPVM